ncbi:toxin CSTX-11-like [Argiope bruennichi]|uniref:toxin CSTX-11-like n=1 Tax=Argiope bruennichi TaxID=94029 RepID=UPI0024942DF6|nr:toxin CSTX-11-like [Argiope bruennichi]
MENIIKMRFAVPCAVICLLLFACAIAEKADEETFPLSESLDELDAAESRMSLSKEEYRKEDRKCIEKHHECTHDKHNCCRGKFFKYECHCHDVVDEKGKKRERCACHNPLRYKVVDLAWNVGTKMV